MLDKSPNIHISKAEVLKGVPIKVKGNTTTAISYRNIVDGRNEDEGHLLYET